MGSLGGIAVKGKRMVVSVATGTTTMTCAPGP